MVTMAEAYLQFLEAKSLSEALHCRLKTFRRYVDDSHARFVDADHAEEFLCVLNSKDDKIQYTIEKENPEGVLAFIWTFRFEITSQEDTNSAFTEKMQL